MFKFGKIETQSYKDERNENCSPLNIDIWILTKEHQQWNKIGKKIAAVRLSNIFSSPQSKEFCWIKLNIDNFAAGYLKFC